MGDLIKGHHEYEIFKNVDSYAKIYPGMTKLFVLNHTVKLRMQGFEPRRKKEHMHSETHDPVAAIDSMRRTKTRLSDIVASNQFEMFCTFTFAKDRYDVNKCKQQMSRWLNNQQTRTGKFDYLIVPEYHKRCEECVNTKAEECAHDDRPKAIHFHALFKGYNGEVVDSGHRFRTGRKKYEIPAYTLGINSVAMIDQSPEDHLKVAGYISKYLKKDMPQFHGKKRYWCSHGLERPIKVTNPILFPSDMAKFGDEIHLNQNMRLYISGEKVTLVGQWGL